MSNATWYYPMPNASDGNGMLEMYSYANTVSGGIFFPVMLFVIFIVVAFSMMAFTSIGTALIVSSFIGLVLSMILAVLGLIAHKFMYLMMLALAVGVLFKVLENRD